MTSREQLRQLDRLAIAGRAAVATVGGFQGRLDAISAGASAIVAGEPSGPDVAEHARTITGQADLMAQELRGVLEFVFPGTRPAPAGGLGASVDEALALLQPLASASGVEVTRTGEAGPVPSRVAGPAIRQLVADLVLNAIEAMPGGGRVTVELGRRRVERAGGGERDWTTVAVQDEGVGIPPELRARIFEPFFTTRPAGQAPGLGLAVARALAEEHGGWIDVESEVARGSRFTVFLPAGVPA